MNSTQRATTYHYSNLGPAIRASEAFRAKMAQFPPLTAGRERQNKSFSKVMDETVGFTDLNNE
jgi:beta-1,4-N-acetylglucosaminyltransferase